MNAVGIDVSKEILAVVDAEVFGKFPHEYWNRNPAGNFSHCPMYCLPIFSLKTLPVQWRDLDAEDIAFHPTPMFRPAL